MQFAFKTQLYNGSMDTKKVSGIIGN